MQPMRSLFAFAFLTLAVSTAPAADPALPWSGDLQKALESARKSSKKVFVDFTGDG